MHVLHAFLMSWCGICCCCSRRLERWTRVGSLLWPAALQPRCSTSTPGR